MSWFAINLVVTAVLTLVCVVAALVARRTYMRSRELRRALQARVVVSLVDGHRELVYLNASVAQLVAARDFGASPELVYLTRPAGTAVRVLFQVHP